MDTLSGSVERITYYNPENGYSVVRLRPEGGKPPGLGRDELVTVVGNLPELAPGEYLRLSGKWVNHPKHGLQFQSEICEQAQPATVAGIRRYLGSGLIKGIGPRLAERIVARFGAQTLVRGVTVTFAATTGHTAGDTWTFTASAARTAFYTSTSHTYDENHNLVKTVSATSVGPTTKRAVCSVFWSAMDLGASSPTLTGG